MLHVILISERTPSWVNSPDLRVSHIRPQRRSQSSSARESQLEPESEPEREPGSSASAGRWPYEEMERLREQQVSSRGVTVVDIDAIGSDLPTNPLSLVPFPLIVVTPGGPKEPSQPAHPLSTVAAMELSDAIFDATTEVFHCLVQGIAALATRGADDLDQIVRDSIHELRTPLTIAIEYAGLVEEGIGGPVPEKVSKFVAQISKACLRLSADLDDMRGTFVHRLGRWSERPEPVSLAPLVESAVGEAEMGELTEATCTLDPEILTTAVSRLVRVAQRLGQGKGPTTVCSSLDVDQVKVTIDFVGLQPSERDQRLFARRAVQDGAQLVTLAGVFGLGASLAERLVNGSGGRMNLEKTPTGGRFVITLPAEVEGAAEPLLRAA